MGGAGRGRDGAGALPGASWSLRPGGNDVSAERFAAFLKGGKPTLRYDELRSELTGAEPGSGAHGGAPSASPGAATPPAPGSPGATPHVPGAPDDSPPPLPAPVRAMPILQVHKSFVVTEDAHGVVIVDQHALHERVMFERLIERLGRGPLEGQRLLAPAVLGVSAERAALVESFRPLLERLGVVAEMIGPRDVAVQVFPSLLFERGVDPAEFLDDLLDKAEREDFVATGEEALRDVLDMMACKAAVKAGDQLSEVELKDLMAMRESVERSSNCPHGRPTSIRLTVRELERLFGRG
jgi:DNA mismatch repair protein MutL